MSDDRFRELMRTAFNPVVMEAPGAPEWDDLRRETTPTTNTRPARWWVALASAAVVLLVGVGTVFIARTGAPDVGGAPRVLEIATLAEGERGPEPRFDTSSLGDEMILESGGLESLAAAGMLPEVLGPESERILSEALPGYTFVGTPTYLGRVGDIHGLVLHLDTGGGSKAPCLFIAEGRYGIGGGCFGPFAPSALASGLRVSAITPEPLSGEPAVLTIDALNSDVAVVGLEFQAGERYWQRPVEGAVLFVTKHEAPSQEVTITVFDSQGAVLAMETLSLTFPKTGP